MIKQYFAQLSIIVLITVAVTPITAVAVDMTQEKFSTAEQAVNALIAANRNNNQVEILKILGPQAKTLIFSGDPVADQISRKKFLDAYDAQHVLTSVGQDKKILIIGNNNWPLPIPLLYSHQQWWFDTEAGKQEILDRRIGRNELNVIEVCRAYVDAQREYADQHPQAHGKRKYAERIISHEGQHDGLYWPVKPGEKQSPLGVLIAAAQAEGYDEKMAHMKPSAYHGYFYKILTGQSEHAPGAMNDRSHFKMTGGFALLAYPAQYGNSGIMTFIVNQDGIVYEKNLGPNTTKIAFNMTQYNPDKSWKPA